MKKPFQRSRCELKSPIYRAIINEKHNGKSVKNGERIGNTMILNTKTNVIEKLV
jgi:hypothetical protein